LLSIGSRRWIRRFLGGYRLFGDCRLLRWSLLGGCRLFRLHFAAQTLSISLPANAVSLGIFNRRRVTLDVDTQRQ
jgi:hypothetical protein